MDIKLGHSGSKEMILGICHNIVMPAARDVSNNITFINRTRRTVVFGVETQLVVLD